MSVERCVDIGLRDATWGTCQQLDAVQIRPGRLPRPLLSER
jgi:hypothetical protein